MQQTPELIYWKRGKFGSSSFTMNEVNHSTVNTQQSSGGKFVAELFILSTYTARMKSKFMSKFPIVKQFMYLYALH